MQYFLGNVPLRYIQFIRAPRVSIISQIGTALYASSRFRSLLQTQKRLLSDYYSDRSLSCIKKGGDLLSRLMDSTIGATGLNFSVRNGKRWNPGAITT